MLSLIVFLKRELPGTARLIVIRGEYLSTPTDLQTSEHAEGGRTRAAGRQWQRC